MKGQRGSVIRRLGRIVLYGVTGLVVLLLLIAGITQTPIFRSYLRSFALSQLDSLLQAQVSMGTLDGNLISGFSIDSIAVRVDGVDLIHADRLDLRYDLFGITGKSLSFSTVRLVRPTIALLRDHEGRWNFEKMIRSSSRDSVNAPGSPFDWTVSVATLELTHARVTLVDSAARPQPDLRNNRTFIDYHNFSLRDLSLTMGARVTPQAADLRLRALSFVDDQDNVTLKELRGTVAVTGNEARVEGLVVRTDRSDLKLDAIMQGLDVTSGVQLESLGEHPVELELRSETIDFHELKKFISELDFLHGSASLDMRAQGLFGDLRIDRLNLGTGSTDLRMSGTVRYLHHPEDLFLDVKITESPFNPHDALVLLPSFGLPDYSALGMTRLNVEFTGVPLDFHTKFHWDTPAGVIHSSDFMLAIGGPSGLRYEGVVFAEKLDLATAVANDRLPGRLNAMVSMRGEGTTLETLNAHMRVVIDSSVFLGQPMESTQFFVDAKERKLSGTAVSVIGPMRFVLNGDLDQRVPVPTFMLEGNVRSLNLERFLGDKSYNSDLTLSMKLDGQGLTWDRLSGDFRLNFLSSRFRQYRIDSGDVRVHLDQKDPADKVLAIESNIADLSLKGSFNTNYMTDLIEYEIGNLQIALGEKLASLDSSLTAQVDRQALAQLERSLAASTDTLDVEYSLRLKNLEPVSVLTSDKRFNGQGVLTGWMRGDSKNLSLYSRLAVDDFFYGNVEGGLLVENASATLEVNDLKPDSPLRDVEVRFDADADKMHINRTRLDSVELTFTYQQEYSSYTASVIAGNDVRIALQGLASVDVDEMLFTLNSLRTSYRDYLWTAEGGASVWFSTRGVRVSDLVMRRDTQSVLLNGFIGVDGKLDASLGLTNINLRALNYLMSQEELKGRKEAFNGRADITVSAGGTVNEPSYNARVTADDVSFRQIPLGRVMGEFTYATGILNTDLKVTEPVRSDSARPRLLVSGHIPVNLRLAGVPEDTIPAAPMDLTIQSDGVQMNILDPLVPVFDDLQGVMKCNLKLGGTPQSPTYKGFITIDSCSFLFVPNNIRYTFVGIFQPEGDRVNVLSATIRNIKGETVQGVSREGEVSLQGDFALRDLKPTDFNLTATGKLLVVKRETRRSSLSVYGNLFLEFEDGLQYTGTFDRSLLSGSITVRNSSLIFPPTAESTGGRSQYYFPVILQDTTHTRDSLRESAAALYFGEVDSVGRHEVNGESESSPSFLDGLRYNLDITASGGNTAVQFVFDAQRDERLEANIEGTINISGEGKRWVGTLQVPSAYYNSLGKRFDASGEIIFAGDYLNPELHIAAQYKGTRTVDIGDERKVENIVVGMNITGNRNKPNLTMSMTIDGKDYEAYTGPKSGDLQNDAIIFILSGTFGTTESERSVVSSNIGTAAGTAVVSGATSLLTGKLSEFLRNETGFINAIEFRYGAGETFSESADIRVSATVYKGLVSFGGRIFESLDNSNISISYSLGDLFSKPSLRNFMVEFERKVDRGGGLTTSNDRNEVKSARLFYRFSF
jgi:hypothetical protein